MVTNRGTAGAVVTIDGDGGRPRGLSRRGFGRTALAALAAGPAAAAALAPRPGAAARPTYLSAFGQRRYFAAHPHQNGFLDGGRRAVLGQMDGPGRASLWLHDLAGGASRKVAGFAFPDGAYDFVYGDVAAGRRLLAASDTAALWVVDLARGSPSPRRLYAPPRGHELDNLVSLRPDGAEVLAAHRPRGANAPTTVVRVRVSDGAVTPLFTKPFHANHLQHSPRDPAWVGFARDHDARGHRERVWGHHRALAPGGRLLWGQRSAGGGELRVGHEVWCRHALSVLVVAYLSSPGSPRGLYEVRPDGRARLVQAADDYVHCNVRHDGRLAVVDTAAGGVVLVDMAGRAPPRRLAATRIAPHPRHPHPHFTPDGAAVVFNDTDAAGRVRVALVPIG